MPGIAACVLGLGGNGSGEGRCGSSRKKKCTHVPVLLVGWFLLLDLACRGCCRGREVLDKGRVDRPAEKFGGGEQRAANGGKAWRNRRPANPLGYRVEKKASSRRHRRHSSSRRQAQWSGDCDDVLCKLIGCLIDDRPRISDRRFARPYRRAPTARQHPPADAKARTPSPPARRSGWSDRAAGARTPRRPARSDEARPSRLWLTRPSARRPIQ